MDLFEDEGAVHLDEDLKNFLGLDGAPEDATRRDPVFVVVKGQALRLCGVLGNDPRVQALDLTYYSAHGAWRVDNPDEINFSTLRVRLHKLSRTEWEETYPIFSSERDL